MSAAQLRPAPDPGSNAGGFPDTSNPTAGITPYEGKASVSGTPFDRDAWLAWRKTGITATDAAAAVNLSPYASPYSVWATKTGLADDDIEVTDSMEFGLRAEKLLGDWFTDREGLYVVGQQQQCVNNESPWMLATVDGAVAESSHSHPSNALGGFEAKTTTDSAKAWDEQIPLHIVAQVQWQMAVTGHQRTWLATLHMGRGVQFRVRVIERDEEDIDVLFAAGFNLWHDHVLTGIAPPTDAHPATTEALGSAWTVDNDLFTLAGAHEEAVVSALHAMRADAKRIDADITALENDLKVCLGAAHALITSDVDAKGRPVTLATWKAQDRTTVDAAALRADQPDLAARYSKTTTSRVLRLTKPKGD